MRNRVIQFALSLALLVILVQVVLVAPSRIRDSESKASLMPDLPASVPAQTAAEPEDGNVDQSMNGMHMIETQEGGKEWELWSDRAISLKSKDTLALQSVRAIFFSSSGVTFTVTGETGSVQTKTKNLRVEGNVVTRSSNGYVFRTQAMEYDSQSHLLTAPDKVAMDGPKDPNGRALHLTGASMEASVKSASMKVMREVKAEKSLDKDRTAYIRSQNAVFSAKDRGALFSGDVILDMDAMRITGPEARFAYDAKGDTVKSVLFSGGARVSDADKWATAQNVKVDFEDNRFIFRGSPRVVQNNDELRGDEIVFLDGGRRVQVKGARARVDEKRLEKVN